MSLIITIFTDDGVVMACDSRQSISFAKKENNKEVNYKLPLSDNTNKLFLCPNGSGIAVCGATDYQDISISLLLKRFFDTKVNSDTPVSELPKLLIDFFKDKKEDGKSTIFHIAGYEIVNGISEQKVYKVIINKADDITICVERGQRHIFFDGDASVILKLLKPQIIQTKYIDEIQLSAECENLGYILLEGSSILYNRMNLQDAIDFAKFLIQTSISFQSFNIAPKTVGGPIDILVIESQESKWIQQKELHQ